MMTFRIEHFFEWFAVLAVYKIREDIVVSGSDKQN
jgi:hypothetical protein